MADIVRTAPASVRQARENSLSVKGAQMFHLLPPYMRNISSDKVQDFKSKLDVFLKEVKDELYSETEGRVADSNCLLHQINQPTVLVESGSPFSSKIFIWNGISFSLSRNLPTYEVRKKTPSKRRRDQCRWEEFQTKNLETFRRSSNLISTTSD